jgi:hypothetical protein
MKSMDDEVERIKQKQNARKIFPSVMPAAVVHASSAALTQAGTATERTRFPFPVMSEGRDEAFEKEREFCILQRSCCEESPEYVTTRWSPGMRGSGRVSDLLVFGTS